MVGFLPRTKARWLFFHDPVVVEQLLMKMSAMVRSSSQQRSLLSMNRSYSRIYAVLMNTAKKPSSAQPVIENLPTQQAIAMMANVSRETVSRAIQALVKMGVVTKDTKRLIVQDVATLEKLARGETDISEVQDLRKSA
jgi:CRP-like cAMP-binding protein